MRKHLIVLAALGFVLMGCKQDPLADYPKEVRGATPGQEGPKEDPIIRDSLFIDSNEFYHVKEGEVLNFDVKGRVLLKNTTFELAVDNLADFKGATFDPATGTFSWKAPQDVVKNELQEILPLKMLMIADNKGSVLVQTKIINIFVLRDLANPMITAINNLTNPVREGSVQYFEAVVKSPEELTKPVMSVVMNRAGIENGSGFVSLRTEVNNPIQNTVDKSLWTFYLQMNLTDADVTNGASNLYFGLQAYSSFGMMSPVYNGTAKVLTTWLEPKNSWGTQEATFVAGQAGSYSFTILDPRDEGRVEVPQFNNCTSLGAVCTCVSTTRSVLNCTMNWTPKATQVGLLRLTYTAYNRSTVTTDTTFGRKDFSSALRVVAAPPPVPVEEPTVIEGSH